MGNAMQMQQIVRRRLAVISTLTLLVALMVPTMVGATQVEDTITIELSGQYRCIVDGQPTTNHPDDACDVIEDREPGVLWEETWEPPDDWIGGVCEVDVNLDNNHSQHDTKLRVGPLTYEGVEIDSSFTDTSRQFDLDGPVSVGVELDPVDLVTSLGGTVTLFCTAQTDDTTPPTTEDTVPPTTDDTTPPTTEDTVPPTTGDTVPPTTEDTTPPTTEDTAPPTTDQEDTTTTDPDESEDTSTTEEETSDTLPHTGAGTGTLAGIAMAALVSGAGLTFVARKQED